MGRLVTNKILLFCYVPVFVIGLNHNASQHSQASSFVGRDYLAQVSATQTNEAKQDQKADPWSSNEIIQLEELARQLSGENKPVVFQTGIIHLYKMGHIPGAKFAGPASSAEGLEKLRDAAKDISRSSEVVIYCGCCPWNDCPNIRPAYKALNEMGFKKVRVLYIPNNFGQDWTLKGLPVEKGE